MDRVTSELGVVIERFRADCGSFSKEIIQTVEQRCNTFYIRAANCESRCEDFCQLKEWKSVEVGYERCDVTSVSIDNLIEGKSYRLVVQRSPLKDKDGKQQTDMFGVIYTYRCILTNNWTSTEKDIITFFPIGLGGGFDDYARTKNPRKSLYQWINPPNVTSIYKSTSQGIMLRN